MNCWLVNMNSKVRELKTLEIAVKDTLQYYISLNITQNTLRCFRQVTKYPAGYLIIICNYKVLLVIGRALKLYSKPSDREESELVDSFN